MNYYYRNEKDEVFTNTTTPLKYGIKFNAFDANLSWVSSQVTPQGYNVYSHVIVLKDGNSDYNTQWKLDYVGCNFDSDGNTITAENTWIPENYEYGRPAIIAYYDDPNKGLDYVKQYGTQVTDLWNKSFYPYYSSASTTAFSVIEPKITKNTFYTNHINFIVNKEDLFNIINFKNAQVLDWVPSADVIKHYNFYNPYLEISGKYTSSFVNAMTLNSTTTSITSLYPNNYDTTNYNGLQISLPHNGSVSYNKNLIGKTIEYKDSYLLSYKVADIKQQFNKLRVYYYITNNIRIYNNEKIKNEVYHPDNYFVNSSEIKLEAPYYAYWTFANNASQLNTKKFNSTLYKNSYGSLKNSMKLYPLNSVDEPMVIHTNELFDTSPLTKEELLKGLRVLDICDYDEYIEPEDREEFFNQRKSLCVNYPKHYLPRTIGTNFILPDDFKFNENDFKIDELASSAKSYIPKIYKGNVGLFLQSQDKKHYIGKNLEPGCYALEDSFEPDTKWVKESGTYNLYKEGTLFYFYELGDFVFNTQINNIPETDYTVLRFQDKPEELKVPDKTGKFTTYYTDSTKTRIACYGIELEPGKTTYFDFVIGYCGETTLVSTQYWNKFKHLVWAPTKYHKWNIKQNDLLKDYMDNDSLKEWLDNCNIFYQNCNASNTNSYHFKFLTNDPITNHYTIKNNEERKDAKVVKSDADNLQPQITDYESFTTITNNKLITKVALCYYDIDLTDVTDTYLYLSYPIFSDYTHRTSTPLTTNYHNYYLPIMTKCQLIVEGLEN